VRADCRLAAHYNTPFGDRHDIAFLFYQGCEVLDDEPLHLNHTIASSESSQVRPMDFALRPVSLKLVLAGKYETPYTLQSDCREVYY